MTLRYTIMRRDKVPTQIDADTFVIEAGCYIFRTTNRDGSASLTLLVASFPLDVVESVTSRPVPPESVNMASAEAWAAVEDAHSSGSALGNEVLRLLDGAALSNLDALRIRDAVARCVGRGIELTSTATNKTTI